MAEHSFGSLWVYVNAVYVNLASEKYTDERFWLTGEMKKMHFYFSVNVFSTKVLIGDTIFYVSNWRRDRHFTWSSEPREGLACCSAKGVPSFLGYFKTLSIGPPPGNEPATAREMFNTTLKFHFCSVHIKFAQ